jgi:hypothetical protein
VCVPPAKLRASEGGDRVLSRLPQRAGRRVLTAKILILILKKTDNYTTNANLLLWTIKVIVAELRIKNKKLAGGI